MSVCVMVRAVGEKERGREREGRVCVCVMVRGIGEKERERER